MSLLENPFSLSTFLRILGSGYNALNSNRLLRAISTSAIDLSAVFIVPIICKLDGTVKGSPDGRVAVSFPFLLSFSIRAISSPNTLEILALFISSRMITKLSSLLFSEFDRMKIYYCFFDLIPHGN